MTHDPCPMSTPDQSLFSPETPPAPRTMLISLFVLLLVACTLKNPSTQWPAPFLPAVVVVSWSRGARWAQWKGGRKKMEAWAIPNAGSL